MMKPKRDTKPEADRLVRDIKRATRRKFRVEEKMRMVLAGLRGEDSIAELCRREGLYQNLFYRWSKEFLEAREKRLAGDRTHEANRADVSDLRKEAAQLKEPLAEVIGEPATQKKRARDWGGRFMRYPATEKLEIIRTVENSALGITATLRQLGIPQSTFYNWYDRFLTYGVEGLKDRKPTFPTSWNKVPEEQRQALLEMALEQPDHPPEN